MKTNHECVLRLTHVTKYFDQRRPVSLWKREYSRIYALNDVSLSVRRGEFVAYAGPNGAGAMLFHHLVYNPLFLLVCM